MMRTHTCGELKANDAGEKVTLCGWVDTVRVQGKIGFLLLRDRHGITQFFLNPSLAKEFGTISKESVLLVEGTVNKRPENQVKKEMPTGEIEVVAEKIQLISRAETPLPIEVAEDTTTVIDKRLDYRFLDLRRKRIEAIFKIRSRLLGATTEFFIKEGFININTPKLTQSGVESGAEEFKIDYFGRKASLAQSPQIYKQMFVISGLEKVFEIGTIFRAEKSHTTRHLTEFVGIDFEMGFIKDEHDVMDVIERYLKHATKAVSHDCHNELQILGAQVQVPNEIPRLDISEIRKLLKERGKAVPEDDDLDAEAEKLLGEIVREKFGSEFVFALNYPWAKRPFYHMRPDGNQKGTRSFDLIYRGVEIGTGAQREHRLDILEKQAAEKGIDMAKLQFYRDIFRFGAIPHGGVGLGVDRIVEQMLNLGNIREAILLPRDPDRLTP
ncbi:MAG: aspartyl-tRNA synthetase [archaeon GW2011_AR3]|nr:MAG: aspartyl-tRNA synthetase [archaeon GW2011_AR3]MBS3109298.1 aspartate--tRNA(Asn) ligase [Candidatus Woesearchaeota archaeon]